MQSVQQHHSHARRTCGHHPLCLALPSAGPSCNATLLTAPQLVWQAQQQRRCITGMASPSWSKPYEHPDISQDTSRANKYKCPNDQQQADRWPTGGVPPSITKYTRCACHAAHSATTAVAPSAASKPVRSMVCAVCPHVWNHLCWVLR